MHPEDGGVMAQPEMDVLNLEAGMLKQGAAGQRQEIVQGKQKQLLQQQQRQQQQQQRQQWRWQQQQQFQDVLKANRQEVCHSRVM